mgnify:CR=1 FL=1
MPTRNSIKCIDLLLGKLRQMTMMKILKNVKKSSQKIPDIFIDNGKIYSGYEEVTEGFNDFFSSIGNKLADKIPPTECQSKKTLFLPILQRTLLWILLNCLKVRIVQVLIKFLQNF